MGDDIPDEGWARARVHGIPGAAGVTSDPADAAAILRAVLDSPRELVIFALDVDYRYLAFNENHARTMREIWGVEIAVGQRMLDVIGREDDRARARENFDRALAGDAFTVVEAYGDETHARRHYENVYSPIYTPGGDVIGLTLFLTDVTDRRATRAQLERYRDQLEALVEARSAELAAARERLLHAQKLESLGLMAGGVAHDFNNLLVSILGSAELAMGLIEAQHPAKTLIAQVAKAATQASDLTSQMLAYAGASRASLSPTDLTAIVDAQRGLLRAMVDASIELVFELDDVPPVMVNPGQIAQILLNLVSNAADAQPEGGRIEVRTRVRHLDEQQRASLHLDDGSPPGPTVMLSVRDEGRGMPPETLERLFDPFFSTKAAGRGLGLSSVLGIVRSHRANIGVWSEHERGTTFEIHFPPLSDAQDDADDASTAQDAHEVVANLEAQAPSLVLIVDDDEQVRGVIEMMFEQLGTRCVTAGDGAVAVMRLEELDDEVDLVVLDLTMPRQGGLEALSVIRRTRPQLPVLLVSGYDAPEDASYVWSRDPYTRFLAKPFTIEAFRSALWSVWSQARHR